MENFRRVASALTASVIGIVVMVVLATVVFFIATFAVANGAGLAGYDPSGDFVVLAAALIVVSVILTGGMTPRMSEQFVGFDDHPVEDPTYD